MAQHKLMDLLLGTSLEDKRQALWKAKLKEDPSCLMQIPGKEFGTAEDVFPDPWQKALLRSGATRILILASRQVGKSLSTSALALKTAFSEPMSLILLMSPTLRQSGELFRDKVMRLYEALGRPIHATGETALTLTLANGSRIISLPGDEKNIRGYSSVKLLVVDEAARVTDALYGSISPMLAVSRGRLVALSTPFGKRGWFYDEWENGRGWERYKVPATECPRIPKEFLDSERKSLGDRWFSQEFNCSFEDAVGSVFSSDDIYAAVSDDISPMAI